MINKENKNKGGNTNRQNDNINSEIINFEDGSQEKESVKSFSKDDDDGDDEDDVENPTSTQLAFLLQKWESIIIQSIRKPIIYSLRSITHQSARYPRHTIFLVPLISVSLLVLGLLTNFRVEVDSDKLWVPQHSQGARFRRWADSKAESGFPHDPVETSFIVYTTNENGVLNREGVRRLFDVVESMKGVEGFDEVCPASSTATTPMNVTISNNGLDDEDKEKGESCEWSCATEFWSSRAEFEATVRTDEDVVQALSSSVFADGRPVYRPEVFGSPEPIIRDLILQTDGNLTNDNDTTKLTSAKSFICFSNLPSDVELDQNVRPTYKLEKLFIDKLLELEEEWSSSSTSNGFHVRVVSERSLDDEVYRSIRRDIPLMVISFVMMGIFCSLFYLRPKSRVKSHIMVGLGAVASVLLALMAGYGLLFCIGIPFTSLTQIFPFILVGIGLDDAFIITGYFSRTEQHNVDVVDRVSHMIENAGMSITVSTFTTFFAFLLGSTNTIPAVRWFCFYAAPCIVIDYIFAITFFVAILVLDHQRIEAGRWDALCCIKTKQPTVVEGSEDKESQEGIFMETYANILLKPITKVIVLLGFVATFITLSVAASNITQEFNFMDLTPRDSYVDLYFDALDETATGDSDPMFWIQVYFRDVDFSSKKIQDSMDSYLSDLQDLDFVTYPPSRYWLNDFREFLSSTTNNNTSFPKNSTTFNNQIDVFLSTPPFNEIYPNHIVRDPITGNITASRTFIAFDKIDRLDISQQMEAFLDQEAVGKKQPINQEKERRGKDWAFFTMGSVYGLWEFYSILVGELMLSTTWGIVAVFVISLLFLPHPLGSLVVTPTVMMIYVELLGVFHVAGLHINSLTAIALIMAIGLVVDYSVHIVFTFFEVGGENRNEKVRGVLKTMGRSVLVGGFTTFLGVVPLAFSQSEVFWTFFVSFLGIVSLGVGHGLIFVPVVLSIVGPMHTVQKEIDRDVC